jgi:hypothetical protein
MHASFSFGLLVFQAFVASVASVAASIVAMSDVFTRIRAVAL